MPGPPVASHSQGKLAARPRNLGQPASGQPKAGLFALPGPAALSSLVYVPSTYTHTDTSPAPLILMMHGASGTAEGGMTYMRDLAEEVRSHGLFVLVFIRTRSVPHQCGRWQAGAILLSPQSRTRTWDAIREGFGKDVESIDGALRSTFEAYNIDRQHLAIGGFSDGASYALSLGLTNGDLFSHIIAFSPGFMVPGKKVGLHSSTPCCTSYLHHKATWSAYWSYVGLSRVQVFSYSKALAPAGGCHGRP